MLSKISGHCEIPINVNMSNRDKLGFNDQGYNKITAITNKFEPNDFGPKLTGLLHKSSLL